MSSNSNLSKEKMINYFNKLGERLHLKGVVSEVAIYGGSSLSLQFDFRESTQDIDYIAISDDTALLRETVKEIADEDGLPSDWFNDSVGDLTQGTEVDHLFYGDYPANKPGLRVFVASAKYLLAMKVLHIRSSMDSSDPFDVYHLLKETGIDNKEDLKDLVAGYFPRRMLPKRSELLIEDMLAAIERGEPYTAVLGY
jgi:hypothetical protein